MPQKSPSTGAASLLIEQAVDFVQSYNPQTKLALPFTPQPAIKTDLRFLPLESEWLEDFYIDISHQYHFAASGNFQNLMGVEAITLLVGNFQRTVPVSGKFHNLKYTVESFRGL